MPAINKQPLFAGTITLATGVFDPPMIEDNFRTSDGSWTNSPLQFYGANGSYGEIIDRITITSTGDLVNTTVNAKLVYVYLYDNDGGAYSLYKTLAMPATTISSTTPNPELELVFQGGLLLKNGDAILIGASTNWDTTGERGDYLSVTIEGGTYNAQ